jgi:2,3-bisphosphoglycerate-dependent phosphoglycerate mutase
MYKVVLIRHGESVWNKENRFTGWVDVDLSEKGIFEAHRAGKALKEAGFNFDIAYTSLLKRANGTLDIILNEMALEVPIKRTWRLNERHYGALQGLNKAETATKYGEDQVKIWRRGYDVAIPPLTKDSPMYPGNDPVYKDLKPDEIPLSENLKNVVDRTVPYWNDVIVPEILNGKKVIVAASGNSLRALVKYLDNMSPEEIMEFNMPTAIPLVYELENADSNLSKNVGALRVIRKYFLADEKTLNESLNAVVSQGKVK